MKEFRSFLSPQIHSFIRYRQASQRWNDSSYEENLMLFDHYCHANDPCATALTQEMVDGWCRQRRTETNNSCRSRIYVVDSFVRFLNMRGLSNVQPPQIPRKERRRYLPHAFTEEKLIRFFHECDSIPVINSRKETIIRKMSVPVFFRLLYSSGIRTNEARLLLKENVDLRRGILDIQYSKGHDQHYIVLHDGRIFLYHRKKLLFPHFKPLVNVPKMYRLQVIYINQLREAVSDDHDTIFLILFFSTASDASHGHIKC